MSKLSRQQVDPGGQNRNFWFIRSILPKGPSELEILLFRHYDRFRQKKSLGTTFKWSVHFV